MRKIVGIVLSIAILLCLAGCGKASAEKYEQAIAHIANGEFLEAKADFDELRNYKDSATKSKQCQYLYAIKLATEKDYVKALNSFNEILSFEDSELKIKEIASLATKDYLNGNLSEEEFDSFLEAHNKFGKKSDIEDVFYLRACEQYANGKYKEAIENIRYITSYEDGTALMDDARYMLAIADCNYGDLCSALDSFESCARDTYRNSVDHAIEIRREILCTPFYGTVSVENGNGDTYMNFQKTGSYANGYVTGSDKLGNQLVKWNFSALFAYDGIILAKDDNVYNMETCNETITQTGIGKAAVYTIRFNDGPLNGMSFTSRNSDNENPVYQINEKPSFTAKSDTLTEIKDKYLNLMEELVLPETISALYSFDRSNEHASESDLSNSSNNNTAASTD